MNPLFNPYPNSIEIEKKLLSALMLKEGRVVPNIAAILEPDDFYRVEHQIIYRAITKIFFQGVPPDILAVEEELRKSDELDKIQRSYLFSLIDLEFTTSRAEYQARIIKEKSDRRKFIHSCLVFLEESQKDIRPLSDIIADARKSFDDISNSIVPSKKTSFSNFFSHDFDSEIENLKNYANRRSGFSNLDQNQFFSPGLYVIGATPAAGTGGWQKHFLLATPRATCRTRRILHLLFLRDEPTGIVCQISCSRTLQACSFYQFNRR